jgi:hypothetical protein
MKCRRGAQGLAYGSHINRLYRKCEITLHARLITVSLTNVTKPLKKPPDRSGSFFDWQ